MWPVLTIDPNSKLKPTPHQHEQAMQATSKNIGILTGGPGTGKSFTTAWIIRQVLESKSGKVLVMGPTGKAAVRITECMQSYDLLLHATTIHSALRPLKSGFDDGNWNFFYGTGNRLEAKYIFVDETSMIPVDLMSSLLSAVKDTAHILFIGDPFQLAPVGHGKPLCDFIESRAVRHGHLRDIHRFAGRIARVCHAIRTETDWNPSPKLDLDQDFPENHLHIEAGQNAVFGKLVTVFDKLKKKYNPFRDIQVICPVNVHSTVSKEKINNLLQSQLNGKSAKHPQSHYRVGDKIINKRNGCFRCAEDNMHDIEIYVANGEIGIIQSFAEDGSLVILFGEKKFVSMPLKYAKLCTDLAYAITGHASQGSQWPIPIIVADSSDSGNMVAKKAWWETVLSRSSTLCITIGLLHVIKRQCLSHDIEKRVTFLPALLRGEMEIEEYE